MNEFEGGVFSKTIEGGRAAVKISFESEGIVAAMDEQEFFMLPYEACRIDIGGNSGRMIFCHHHDFTSSEPATPHATIFKTEGPRQHTDDLTIFCEEKEFLTALNSASRGLYTEQIENIRIQTNQKTRKRNIFTAVILSALLLFSVGGYYGLRYSARAAIKALPMSVDEQIGDMAIESMDLKGKPVEDEVVKQAIEDIVQQLSVQVKPAINFNVQVIDAPIVNAFALPGGNIVVYTGLIKKSESPEQVAGVIAHEMAHVSKRHGLQRISQSVGVIVAINLLIGDASSLVALGAEVLKEMAISSYSRDQENEADFEGVTLLHNAGINPIGLAEFFELLKKEESSELVDAMSWISSHPKHDERIEAVKKQVKTLPKIKYKALAFDWADIRKRVGFKAETTSE